MSETSAHPQADDEQERVISWTTPLSNASSPAFVMLHDNGSGLEVRYRVATPRGPFRQFSFIFEGCPFYRVGEESYYASSLSVRKDVGATGVVRGSEWLKQILSGGSHVREDLAACSHYIIFGVDIIFEAIADRPTIAELPMLTDDDISERV